MENIEINELYINNYKASDLAKKYGTPLIVMDKNEIKLNCFAIKNDFLNVYPKTRAAYAAKAFLTEEMCNLINEQGLCLDVVSGGELQIAMNVNFPAERIEFNGNNKTIKEIEKAVSYGVGRIIIDGTDEIELIDEVCSKLNKKVNVLIRISPGVDSHTHKYISTGQIDSKFGIPLAEEVFTPCFKRILNSKYANLMGFHFHIGSQLFENTSHLMATDITLNLVKKVYDEFDFITKEINIGGGFGINYTDEIRKSYEYFVAPIMSKIYEFYDTLNWEYPSVVIEPGRSIVGEAGTTLYTIGTIKNIPNIRTYVSVDGGMTDNIRPALYGAEYRCDIANKLNEEKTDIVTICGKCCESGDILIKNTELPKAKRGDILAVYSTGAYCYSMSSNYNGIEKPQVIII